MAFGAGVLISAVAYDLVDEAVTTSAGSGGVGLGLFAGALAAPAGYALFDDASASSVAFVQAFAGGAILTMLADTMMPEAFEHGGRLVGLATTLGFALAFAISALE
jgi:ZIP family zinc transporter